MVEVVVVTTILLLSPYHFYEFKCYIPHFDNAKHNITQLYISSMGNFNLCYEKLISPVWQKIFQLYQHVILRVFMEYYNINLVTTSPRNYFGFKGHYTRSLLSMSLVFGLEILLNTHNVPIHIQYCCIYFEWKMSYTHWRNINVNKFRLSTDYWGYNGFEVPHNKNAIKWRHEERHREVYVIYLSVSGVGCNNVYTTKWTTLGSIKITDFIVVINRCGESCFVTPYRQTSMMVSHVYQTKKWLHYLYAVVDFSLCFR